MANRAIQWMRNHPLAAFYLLAFGVTWAGWLPQAAYSRGLFPFDSPIFYILGGVGPLLAVFLVEWALSGKLDAGKIFEPYLRWRVGLLWYLVALFGYAGLWIVALIWRGELAPELARLGPLSAMLPVFLISFLAAIPEQVAWRGFALLRLQARYSALVSSLIVGALWAVWHLPLLLNANSVMSTYPLGAYLIYVIAVSVIYAWIFNNTRHSLLIVTLFHAACNTVGPFAGMEQALIVSLAAVFLVVVYGPSHLSRHSSLAETKEKSPAALHAR